MSRDRADRACPDLRHSDRRAASANATVNPAVALIAPALGGLSLGIMEWSRRRLKISSAVDPIEANALRGGRLSVRDSVVVSGQTMISNGCGASVGLEAGYTQIGSGSASLIGKFFNLRRNDLRLIVGCGAAAAIAAAFGAPITGAFYACELIVGVYSVGSAAPILAASLAGALTAQWLGGAPYSLEVSHGRQRRRRAISGAGRAGADRQPSSASGHAQSSVFERVFAQKWLPVWLGRSSAALSSAGLRSSRRRCWRPGHGAMVLDLHSRDGDRLHRHRHRTEADGLPGLAGLGLPRRSVLLPRCSSAACSESSSPRCWCGRPGLRRSIRMVSMLTGMATLGVAIVGGPLTMSFLVLEMTRNVDVTAVVLAGCIVTSDLRPLHVRPFVLDLAPASARRDHPQRQRRRLAAQPHGRAHDAHRRRQGAVDHDHRRVPSRIRCWARARRSSSSTTATNIAGWCCCRSFLWVTSTRSRTISRSSNWRAMTESC